MTLIEMQAAIKALQAEAAESKTKLAAVEGDLAKHQAENKILKTALEASEASAKLATDEAGKAGAKIINLEAAKTQLEAANDKLKSEARSASDRAVDIAAAAGHPPVSGEADNGDETREALLTEYGSIKNPLDRAKFYTKHRAVLIGL